VTTLNAPGTSALRRCLVAADELLGEHWGREPLLQTDGDPGRLDDVIDLADIDQLIASTASHYPEVVLVKDGKPVEVEAYTNEPDALHSARRVDPVRVFELFQRGATIKLQGAQHRLPRLAAFCRELELELGLRVGTNVYVTPPGSRGLHLHFDPYDVIAVQLRGSKHWELFRPIISDPLPDYIAVPSVPTGPAWMEATLGPGGAVYLPRGFFHRVRTMDEPSIHLTIGLQSEVWIDVLARVVQRAESEPDLRRSVPPRFLYGGPNAATELQQRIEALITWLTKLDVEAAASWLATSFWADRPPLLGGQLGQLLGLARVDDDTVVRRRPSAVPLLSGDDDTIVILLGANTIEAPAAIRPALEFVLDRDALSVSELKPFLDEESRLVLVRRLIREGLLEQVERG
jgi:hypothetical protein